MAVVLKATGEWHVNQDPKPIRAGQELAARATVFAGPSDRSSTIVIKVYGRARPDRYTAPARIPLPEQAGEQPGMFEQFMKLLHRLMSAPGVPLVPTLAWNWSLPGAGDVFVSVDPLSKAPSGDVYVVRKYDPFSGALGIADGLV
ncbi:MAG TPA: hypothetical protein VMB21_14755, partial [Candidatus Limnocylindria bacterium]|nr:hypothetical protein [Candidatus Limnocylindria bacterium]